MAQPQTQDAAWAGAREAADTTRRMACGGLAGMIAKTATNPLDRIKILNQTGEHGSKGKETALSLYRNIIRNEGVLGLWAGNGANLLRIFPTKAVVFSTNDFYSEMLANLSGWPGRENSPSYLSFLAGGMAGVTASAATYPLELARGRITGKLAGPDKTKHYKGIVSTVLMTCREEGIRALYRGITPSLIGSLLAEGIKFGTVGVLEDLFPRDAGADLQSLVYHKVLFGGCGGAVSGLLLYPNDTMRRMLQMQGSRGTNDVYSGYWDCFRQTYARSGLQRFYHGLAINMIRMAPNSAIQFGAYEVLKQITGDGFR